MIANNPYNLPDKIMIPNQTIKTIPLQNKKSRDRSQQFSKELSSKGIKLQSQMKKSIHLQHVTSSPNLHTISTSSSSNRQIESQNIPRQIQYHQTHIIQPQQSENERKMKFLFEKFYQITDQLNSHQSMMSKFITQKQIFQRSSRDLSFDYGNGIQKGQKQQNYRNQSKGLHLNHINGNLQGSQNIVLIREIQQVKKQLNGIKQQISQIKANCHKGRQHQSVFFNRIEDKFKQQLSRVSFTFQQLKSFSYQKFTKIQNNLIRYDGISQSLGQKVHKNKQRIDSLETNIENHMNLVNQQINNALSKIVVSINEKISKTLQNNISIVNQKLKKNLQKCKGIVEEIKKSQHGQSLGKIQKPRVIISGMNIKPSEFKAKTVTRQIKIKSIVQSSINQNEEQQTKQNANSSNKQTKNYDSNNQIILGQQIYYIDQDGYLLDQNQFYLIDQNNNLLQLQSTIFNRLTLQTSTQPKNHNQ